MTSFHQLLDSDVHIQDSAHQAVHLLVQTLKPAGGDTLLKDA